MVKPRMALLWLADSAYGSDRVCRAGKRVRLRLPKVPWLQNRFADAGVDIDWHGYDVECRAAAPFQTRALVRVDRGTSWDGLLTPWTLEEEALHEYYGLPDDAYSIMICDVFELQVPRPARLHISHQGLLATTARRSMSQIFKPHGFGIEDVADLLGDRVTPGGGREPCSIAACLATWGFQPSDVDAAKMLVQVKPIVDLTLLRKWDRLLLRSSWQCVFPAIPEALPEAPARRRKRRRRLVDDDDDLAQPFDGRHITHEMVSGLMADLRRWPPAILVAGTDTQEERAALEFSLSGP